MSARRDIYVYWKTGRPDVAAGIVRVAQDALCAAEPGLQAQLVAREPRHARPATLMEIYRRDGGVDVDLQARIERTLTAATQGLVDGRRHVEVFVDV